MKAVAILGSTGSIGTQALDVVARFPDRFRVVSLAAGQRVDQLAEQVRRFEPACVAVGDARAARRLAELLPGCSASILWGDEGLRAVATQPEAQVVLAAVVGFAGLGPTLAALEAGKDVALANKETLVAAGHLVVAAAARTGARIIPVDSEHSALFQCLEGRPPSQVRRLLLTASGGPFRGWSREQLAAVTVEQALRHPRWRMGPKVTIDSATLMNKALEVIEAHWLFGLPQERIDVVIHPESIVHSLVELADGSVLAQLGVTDMRLPIGYALSYPERLPSFLDPLDLPALGSLHFAAPDPAFVPSLNCARQAITMGGTLPAAMNAANEVAVAAFLRGEIAFLDIVRAVEQVMEAHPVVHGPDLAAILDADAHARQAAQRVLASRRTGGMSE